MRNIKLKSRSIKNKRLFSISYFNESLAQYTADLEENPFEDTNDDMYSKSMSNYNNFILPKPLPNSKAIISKRRVYIKIRGVIQSRISEDIIVGLFHQSSHINKSLGLCRQGVDNDEFFKINQ